MLIDEKVMQNNNMEEEINGENAFDDTLENVMTIDESNEAASVLSGDGKEKEDNKAD